MITIWYLVIVFYSGHSAVTVPIETREACLFQADYVKKKDNFGYKEVFCVQGVAVGR